jgi:asparagine synthase (glutamine-hydrolysing)
MCGIAGYLGRHVGSGDERITAMAETMCRSIAHRGPDDTDVWASDDGGVVLGHRRLSILDLSPLGRNPMAWDGGRLRITYNGEVYNYRELRAELEQHGCRFRSQTDTEVILAAYDRWGIDCLHHFVGMFAFAIWDEPRQRLFMARDRLGKKPLYYSARNGGLSFASELKALAADPGFPRTLDRAAVSLYLQYGYVPAPYSIFSAARKLPPAHYAVYERGELRIARYWDPVAVALSGPYEMSETEADERLERLLLDAVERRMIADVPVGAFLSGGIDSSLVVALMQEVGSSRARTFTIRFENPEYDESAHAAAVAKHLGTEHQEESCGVAEMLDVVERLPAFFDEPFADSSAIPTYLVSRATRGHVTVALSGDGGDELFFGYPRYFLVTRGRWLLGAPRLVRRAAARVAAASSKRRMRRAADILVQDEEDPYARFVSWWGRSDRARFGATACDFPAYVAALERVAALEPRARPPVLDVVSYLPEDILTKVDRASMAASLETRCPLLDHRVAEFALTLPLALRMNGRTGKLPLRRLLARRVPRALTDRPKMGFGVPLADWLRGPLRVRMASYVDGPTLSALGLDPTPARLLWRAFLAGRAHRTDQLWSVFALAAWAESWKPDPIDPLGRVS